jgi:hypothetical protein
MPSRKRTWKDPTFNQIEFQEIIIREMRRRNEVTMLQLQLQLKDQSGIWMRSRNNLIRTDYHILIVARIRSSLHVGSHKLCLLLTPALSLTKSPETTKEEVEL